MKPRRLHLVIALGNVWYNFWFKQVEAISNLLPKRNSQSGKDGLFEVKCFCQVVWEENTPAQSTSIS